MYGDGIIALSYPNLLDIRNFKQAQENGLLKKEWKKFCDKHWRPIYEHQAEVENKPLEDIVIDGDFGKMTFSKLYESVPSEQSFNIPLSIHGTNDPDCIGHDISAGCIRMHNEHISKLIDQYVALKTPVLITFTELII